MALNLYLFSWLTIVFLSIILSIIRRDKLLIFSAKYFEFIFIKWKITIFLLALVLLSSVGLLWFDPTWDLGISIWMATLTYITAPYSVWVFYRFFSSIDKNLIELYIALILTFLSASWFYDWYNYFYLLWFYPITWVSNIFYSIPIYLLWWLVWNLNYNNKLGVYFSFYDKDWFWSPQFKSITPFIMYIYFFWAIFFWWICYFIYLINI